MPLAQVSLDGMEIKDFPPEVSLSRMCAGLDRALIKFGRRIGGIRSGDTELLKPEVDGSKALATFDRLVCKSEPIPKILKRAVMTLNVGTNCQGMYETAAESFSAYAKKVGADFLTFDTVKLDIGGDVLFEKWQLYEQLFKYDRIFFVDADILISPACPDVFDLVPAAALGGFVEDDYEDRSRMILGVQSFYGDLGWRKGYVNSGVGVYSWLHRSIFERPSRVERFRLAEQNLYNFRMRMDKVRIMRLPAEFNRMNICGPIDERFEGYLIHYAGDGYNGKKLPPDEAYKAKAAQMRSDWKRLQAQS